MIIRHFQGGGGGHDTGGVGTADAGGDTAPGGWAWVPPIPPCAEVQVSLEILTRSGDATLLYAGPEEDVGSPEGGRTGASKPSSSRDLLLLLELRQGRPSLLLDLGGGALSLSLNASYTIADNTWHRIDLLWKDQGSIFNY